MAEKHATAKELEQLNKEFQKYQKAVDQKIRSLEMQVKVCRKVVDDAHSELALYARRDVILDSRRKLRK